MRFGEGKWSFNRLRSAEGLFLTDDLVAKVLRLAGEGQ
jgi:hypothetical protein